MAAQVIVLAPGVPSRTSNPHITFSGMNSSCSGRMALLTLVLALFATGCARIAVGLAPRRTAQVPTEATRRGEALMSEALLDGAYDRLPSLIEELTRLAVDNPRDGRLHTMLGMAHLWRVSERERDPHPSPRLTEHVVLARHYLASARTLLPEDARVHAWSAGTELATATLLDDQRARRRAYFDMKDSIPRYPMFNLFSASFVFSRLPATDPKYLSEVVDPMFEAVRICYGKADDWKSRRAAVAAAMANPIVTNGPERVCYPSPAAPHNIEGFFLHFGDALSKAGRLDDAREAWGLASLAPAYATWPYRSDLEARIADPAGHSRVARAGQRGEGMMITSRVSCSGCHQR